VKEGIHPDYREVVFVDMSNGFKFITRSTVGTRETIKMDDGKEYPLFKLDVSRRVASLLHRRPAARQRDRPRREVPPEVRAQRQRPPDRQRLEPEPRRAHRAPGDPDAGLEARRRRAPPHASGSASQDHGVRCATGVTGSHGCLSVFRGRRSRLSCTDASLPGHRCAGRQAAPLGTAAAVRLYLLPGFIGRDPWRQDDAASFGVA
jgi:ribosomal protein L31